MPDRQSTDYINSTEYTKLEDKLKELKSILDDLQNKQDACRKLRYAEVDIEAEREAGRLQPDELYIPQHIIDTNIRREQSPYVQFITQSPRAVICTDKDDPTFDLSALNTDLTERVRYDGWQLPMFACIDGFQSNGYGIMEVIQDLSTVGELAHEFVPFGDFAFTSDTRDIQAVEYTARTYYYTKTRLLALCGDGSDPENQFSREQVDKIIEKDPDSTPVASSDNKDKSLYKVYKNMFRVNGIVNVAWSCPETCDDWVRKPRPLFIGRRKAYNPTLAEKLLSRALGKQAPQSVEDYETNFPYILFPYLISENDTISQLKGRVFLDQDLQEAVSSLLSSTVTKARRSAGLYFSKDVSDPNDDLLLQKNIFFRSGCLINSKVTEFQLQPPDPAMFSAIQMLITANQNETSQVNFAANNRKDSRKTAKEIETSERQEQQLSTVQVVLFAIALTQMYRLMNSVIRSRVLTGLLTVSDVVKAQYARNYVVKPAGDVDVIQRQQLIQSMMNSWPVVQNTPAANVFLCDMLELMFPLRAARYVQIIQQAEQQKNSAQAQQMQQMLAFAKQMGDGIIYLSQHREFFSDSGQLHALPVVERAATQLQQLMQTK